MAKASRDPYLKSREVKRQSLIDTLYQIVDEIISEMPLNRVAKTDYVSLKETADSKVEELRARGKWDN